MGKKVETCSGNSINRLPDEILGQILSLIPTKVAASTSILSKRWRNLLPLVDSLDFDDSMARDSSLIDFVERTLVLLGNSPIKKFSLKQRFAIEESRYKRMIKNVLERGVSELHLSSSASQCLEPEFFFSKTLVLIVITASSLALCLRVTRNVVGKYCHFCSRNLQTLVIKGLFHEITDQCGDVCVCVDEKKSKSCLLSFQVKVLKIYEYGGSSRELKQMRHFMENLRCLELVKVKVQVDMRDNYSPLAHDLMKLASSKCQIQFI